MTFFFIFRPKIKIGEKFPQVVVVVVVVVVAFRRPFLSLPARPLTCDVDLGARGRGSGDILGVTEEAGVVVGGGDAGDGQSDDAAGILDRDVGRALQGGALLQGTRKAD